MEYEKYIIQTISEHLHSKGLITMIEKYFTMKYILEYVIPITFFGILAILLIMGYVLTRLEDYKKHKWLKKNGFRKVVKEIQYGSMLDLYEWKNEKGIRMDTTTVNRLSFDKMVEQIEKELNNDN